MNEMHNRSGNNGSNVLQGAITISKTLKEPVLAMPNSSNSNSNSNNSIAGSNSSSSSGDDEVRCHHGKRSKSHSWRKSGGICDSLWLSVAYAIADFKRRPRNMVIGIIAVFFLVFFTGMFIAGITKTPYIILRLS